MLDLPALSARLRTTLDLSSGQPVQRKSAPPRAQRFEEWQESRSTHFVSRSSIHKRVVYVSASRPDPVRSRSSRHETFNVVLDNQPQWTVLAEFISLHSANQLARPPAWTPLHQYGFPPCAAPCRLAAPCSPQCQQAYEQWKMRGESLFF
jgi:hypothetical protein